MSKAPKNETYEEKRMRLMQAGYNNAKSRKQNRNEDGILKVSDDELWVQAARYADKYLERDARSIDRRREIAERMSEEDEDYRQRQEMAYREDYEWNTSNDEASLDHLLNLEIQGRQINREIDDMNLTAMEKDKLRKTLIDITKERRQLEQSLGIDRVTRAKKDERGDPMDDWERIKQQALVKKQQQRDELVERAAKVRTEAELRDMIKVGLLVRFDVVDAILANHRRVLDLPMEVQKS